MVKEGFCIQKSRDAFVFGQVADQASWSRTRWTSAPEIGCAHVEVLAESPEERQKVCE